MNTFKLIEINAATPRERGVQYGEQARVEIDRAVEFYRRKFEKNQDWNNVLGYALRYLPVVEDYAPDHLEELRGIADGSCKNLAEIMVVNCRYEISKFPRVPECTTAAVLSPVTEGGKNYLIKNCDLYQGVDKHMVLLHIVRPDGYRGFGLTEAGQLVRDGYNSYGVALVNNALQSRDDYPEVAVPGTFVRKKIWESKTFEEACSFQRSAKRTVSTNMIIAHKSGVAVNFEAYPGGADELYPTGGILTHANHFVKAPGRDADPDAPKTRDVRLRQLLEAKAPAIMVPAMMEALRDHEHFPLSICRHEDGLDTLTVSSMIIDMTDDIIYVCANKPCEHEYQIYTL